MKAGVGGNEGGRCRSGTVSGTFVTTSEERVICERTTLPALISHTRYFPGLFFIRIPTISLPDLHPLSVSVSLFLHTLLTTTLQTMVVPTLTSAGKTRPLLAATYPPLPSPHCLPLTWTRTLLLRLSSCDSPATARPTIAPTRLHSNSLVPLQLCSLPLRLPLQRLLSNYPYNRHHRLLT